MRFFAAPLLLASIVALPACSGGNHTAASTGGPDAGSDAGGDAGREGGPPYVSPCKEKPFVGNPLGSRCGRLIDGEGRVVALRGVNARVLGVFDVTWSASQPPLMPIPAFTASDAAGLREFGFDALRLPLSWSAIEPNMTGGYDESYLDAVAKVVGYCHDAGVRVLLDLHQDDYSKMMGGDGAPLWAISPPPTMIGPTPPGVTAATEAQVVDAFDTFFGTSAEGAGLQNAFIVMASHVAARFANDPTVIGLEIYNEPPIDIATLLPFYRTALGAVRQVMPDKLFAFEPSAFRNLQDYAPLGNGSLGPGTAYAPHIYTFVFNHGDMAAQESMTKAELEPSNEDAAAEAASWDAPPLVTEWGYGPTSPHAEDFFTWQSELQEQYMLSSFMWLWKEESSGLWGCFDYDATSGAFTERPTMKKALARVRPAAVAGWPGGYSFDRATGVFSLTFQSAPDVTAPHLISVAPLLGAPLSVTCDGAKTTPQKADTYGTLAITCGQGDGEMHTLGVKVAPLP
jgi:endoglycosylceramidase